MIERRETVVPFFFRATGRDVGEELLFLGDEAFPRRGRNGWSKLRPFTVELGFPDALSHMLNGGRWWNGIRERQVRCCRCDAVGGRFDTEPLLEDEVGHLIVFAAADAMEEEVREEKSNVEGESESARSKVNGGVIDSIPGLFQVIGEFVAVPSHFPRKAVGEG